ncbi:lysophospholipase II [Galdieria sulphuraria]|uniref:Lysophospholipase II n=1 Tax=Galdieria sulphuraria TaxID=130081 RepID=M2XAG9_GALSU|nr:lysophospholipase II [Galdieria sulphuraria]EME26857.1 lysophospholipase II [Galdieria sulphuraria]|eukprot:XP_005703377.1 lysophospholipase II [Galdieria sulphuraria]
MRSTTFVNNFRSVFSTSVLGGTSRCLFYDYHRCKRNWLVRKSQRVVSFRSWMSAVDSSASVRVISSKKAQDSTLILLHGFGSSASDLVALAESVAPPSTKCILPEAPLLNDAPFPVRGWFSLDLTSHLWYRCSDKEGLESTLNRIFRIVEDEVEKRISLNRIFIGGFSQGGAVTLNCMLRSPYQLGGFFAASSWLVGEEEYPAKLSSTNLETPLFMGHGEDDAVVPFALGKRSAELIRSFGLKNILFRNYPRMDHFINEQERRDIESFLSSCYYDRSVSKEFLSH